MVDRGSAMRTLVSVLALFAHCAQVQAQRPANQSVAPSTPTGPTRSDAPDTPQRAREVAEAMRLADAWLDASRAFAHIPGMSAAVVVGDSMVWSKGYGTIDANHRVAATPATIYSICSISKLFTSVALMQQAEAGKVRLDDPISTYLPWATPRQSDPDSGPITIRAAMTHSAGLPREADFAYWTAPDFTFPTREQLQSAIGSQTTLFGVGRHYQYSNLGMTLVGETVAAVSGVPYADYVQARILDPLRLRDTRPFLPMALYGKRLSAGFGALDREGRRTLLHPFDAKGLTPAAGFTSTVEDLSRFAIWQFNLLREGGTNVIRASTLREMQRPQYTDPDWQTTFGLGFSVWRAKDKTFIGHVGSCPGYQSMISMNPESETAVVIMHNGSDNPRPLARGVFALLAKRQGYSFKAPVAVPGLNLEEYAGRYSEQPWEAEGVVVPWAGGLAYLTLPSDDPTEGATFLKPVARDLFRRVRDDGSEAEEVRFARDASGKVVRMTHFMNSVSRIEAARER